jgi:hypothetical protein
MVHKTSDNSRDLRIVKNKLNSKVFYLILTKFQTCMCQAQRPQTQVGGRVRDAAQKVLNRVNTLLHSDFAHIKLKSILNKEI